MLARAQTEKPNDSCLFLRESARWLGMPPALSVEFDSDIDWLLIRHDDEAEAVTQATEKAFLYLRALKQSIPTIVPYHFFLH